MTAAATPPAVWLPPQPGLHVIIGPNDVGKTHLLERLPGNALVQTRARAIDRKHKGFFDFARTQIELAFPHYTWNGKYTLFEPAMSEGMKAFVQALCGIICTPEGEIAALDNPDVGMEPAAIHRLFAAVRRWCMQVQTDITAVIATHSASVLDEFNERGDDDTREGPDNVWVITSRGATPRRITEFHTRDWLSRFHLSSLFLSDALVPGWGKE